MTEIKPQDIEAVIESFDSSSWSEMRLKISGLELFLSKDPSARAPEGTHAAARVAPIAAPHADSAPLHSTHATAAPRLKPAPHPVEAKGGASDVPESWIAVRAPNLGTFYRAPKPGAPPYVAVGQRVEPTTEVCLIEVMKLFTSVPAGVAGFVRKVLVEDAELVEFDQPLFLIEPA
ncbi:MAG TPA: biotin/lipoyl-containing protein [Roseiarcus sp.]|nr:biotin/lipoyl-containing protein [Roseiarcus sp.]